MGSRYKIEIRGLEMAHLLKVAFEEEKIKGSKLGKTPLSSALPLPSFFDGLLISEGGCPDVAYSG